MNEQEPLRIIGEPKRKENGDYYIEEYAILGRECGWICPRCANEVRIKPDTAGLHTFTCRCCSATFQVMVEQDATTFLPHKIKEKTAKAAADADFGPAVGILLEPAAADADTPQTPQEAIHQQPEEAKPQPQEDFKPADDEPQQETQVATVDSTGTLQWGGFFSRKRFTLKRGANIIGRQDPVSHSDIEIDDPQVSRRSVKIDATATAPGRYKFTLTVLKSLNPVLVNDRQIKPGNPIPLNADDTIVMGKTTITFKTDK